MSWESGGNYWRDAYNLYLRVTVNLLYGQSLRNKTVNDSTHTMIDELLTFNWVAGYRSVREV